MQKYKRQFLGAAIAALTAVTFTGQAQAQNYPERDVTAVIQWGAGGGTDVAMRGYAPYAEEALGKKIILQNKPGAAGAIGLQHVLAAPEGAELVLGTDSDVVLAPLFNPELKYRPGQFRLLSVLGSAPMALIARHGFDAARLQRLVAGDAGGDGDLRLASYGIGSNAHLLADDFARRLALRWLHVPYRGFAPMLQDLMGGTVDAAFVPFTAGVPDLVRSGKLQLLGVAASHRRADAPQIPTFEELGLHGFVHRSWSALFVPAAAGAGTATSLRAAAMATTSDAEVRRQLAAIGLADLPLASAEAAQGFLDAEVARYRSLLSALHAQQRMQAP